MKTRIFSIYFLFIGIFFSLFTQNLAAQALPDSLKNLSPNPINFTADLFAFDLSLNVAFRLNKKLSIGIEGELGVNLSDPIAIRFAKFEVRDDLLGILGGAFFMRIHNTKLLNIDFGYRNEAWLGEKPDGGFSSEEFSGFYTKLFLIPKFRVTKKGLRHKTTIGARLSFGNFKKPTNNIQNKYKAFLLNFWIRIPLSHDLLF